MDKKPSQWQMLKIKFGLGVPFARTVDLGEAEETVIRFKDKFISVLEGKDGEIKNLSWSGDSSMFHILIKEFWVSKPPESKERHYE